ncbi:MAG: zf-TFIIB domain-containing protein [Sphingopyxis sp.]|nr:zf-TFIIB domain-containing protein [Sphingopyxis sp.]
MRTAEAVSAMPCPNCRTGLTLSERSGVEIDYCQTCRGVWLDRGELDKIIERSARDAFSGPRQDDQRRHDHRPDGYRGDDHRHHRPGVRKKSFLSDLFD